MGSDAVTLSMVCYLGLLFAGIEFVDYAFTFLWVLLCIFSFGVLRHLVRCLVVCWIR